ncbi:Uncharacterized protein LHYA1_G007817 [Lachnellula hyalina]|uniref:BTB/POZ domain-containing protein n=1 Tax=Lachnellula hyalina TaxID=1316788 RepID=A0A8H8QWU8_9HELO|nr:Uncharacterized protein LHYA1_G007817 [Lachnellula hyalina]TVY24138.1 Uncharacterized protein LHYA1_G007817 [Lachnellula hyalina]
MAMANGGEGSSQGKKATPTVSGLTILTEDIQKNVDPNPPGILRDSITMSARKMNTDIPEILPHERVFPIQIGSELFRLSGASISSDAEEHGNQSTSVRTLYIDRDPVTFRDISLHLQGYHVAPRDGSHFVKLFADAQFYSLPRLMSQLHEESIFISIGNREFQIPRELFSDPGNSPNYFSLGFAVFFTTPTEIFPGLSREGLLRPPSILPPSVPNRSAETFSEIMHLLRGYPLNIRNEDHRAELLRDCKYFHLKGLEQKLVRHSINFNLARRNEEITLRLEDVRQSGISVVGHPPPSSSPTPEASHTPQSGLVGFVNYARPFVDAKAYELVLEIGDERTMLHITTHAHTPPSLRAEFFGDAKTRISRLFEVIATKLNLPTTQPLGLLMKRGGASSQPASPGNTPLNEGDHVQVSLGSESWVQLDGREWKGRDKDIERDEGSSVSSSIIEEDHPRKRRRMGSGATSAFGDETWLVKTAQWRLRVQNARNGKGGVECVLVAVKINAVSGELGRNAQRMFLA